MEEESNDLKLLNYDRHKEMHLTYKKIFMKFLRAIPSDWLIDELKRRKIVKIDWNTRKIVKR